MKKLYIIGYGMGDKNLVSNYAKQIIDSSDQIFTTTRLALHTNNKCKELKLSQIYEELDKEFYENICVIVSGDVGFFSASKIIKDKFDTKYEIFLINGFNSLQYFSSKLKINYDDIKTFSMHGRQNSIVPTVTYNEKVFVLTGGNNKVNNICHELTKNGLGNVYVSVGENLSYKQERIISGSAFEISKMQFDNLAVMYIQNSEYILPNMPMFDKDFIRGNIPMTKEEIRWICIQKLCLLPNEIVFDIGAGTGSISIEMAKKVYEGYVYAIEQKKDACELINQNIEKHKTFNVQIVNEKAPIGLSNLPMPDKAIIGGSTGNMKAIVRYLLNINENIKIVVTAITLETINDIIESFKLFNLNFETVCINSSKAKKVGEYNMMIANNPVYVIVGQKVSYE